MKTKILPILLVIVIVITSQLTNLLASDFGECSDDWEENVPFLDADQQKQESLAASLPSNACGQNLNWMKDGNTLLINGIGDMINYNYSADVNTPWYEIRNEITKIVIADGVTSIGDAAFHSFGRLTDVQIPDSVTRIGKCAFYGCSNLKEITLPDCLTEIEYRTFYGCKKLAKIQSGNHEPNETTVPETDIESISEIGYGRLTIKWLNLKKTVDGYELRWSTDPSFESNTRTASFTKTQTTLVNLIKGATYYVAVRTYKEENGENIYSKWSDTSSIDLKLPDSKIQALNDNKAGKLYIAWMSRGEDVDGYELRWSTDPTYSKGVKQAAYTGRSTNKRDLSVGTTYYFSVRTYKTFSGKKVYSDWSVNKSVKLAVPATKIATLSDKGSGKLQITCKSLGNIVNGYQYQWSIDSSFKTGKKTVTSKSNTIIRTGLITGAQYYVRARSVKVVNKVKIYSVWSSAKKVTMKVPATAITKLEKAGAGKLKVYWNSLENAVQGYQIQCSTNKNFESGNKTLNKGRVDNSMITKLQNGATYYVRIRAVKVVSGKKVFSAWSKTKAIKV